MAAVLLVAAAFAGWVALERGELGLHLFLIFPVLSAQGAWGAAAVLLAFGAVLVLMLKALGRMRGDDGAAISDTGERERRTSAGGVVLIGPIPIVLGSDNRTALIALAVAVTVLAILLLSILFQ